MCYACDADTERYLQRSRANQPVKSSVLYFPEMDPIAVSQKVLDVILRSKLGAERTYEVLHLYFYRSTAGWKSTITTTIDSIGTFEIEYRPDTNAIFVRDQIGSIAWQFDNIPNKDGVVVL